MRSLARSRAPRLQPVPAASAAAPAPEVAPTSGTTPSTGAVDLQTTCTMASTRGHSADAESIAITEHAKAKQVGRARGLGAGAAARQRQRQRLRLRQPPVDGVTKINAAPLSLEFALLIVTVRQMRIEARCAWRQWAQPLQKEREGEKWRRERKRKRAKEGEKACPPSFVALTSFSFAFSLLHARSQPRILLPRSKQASAAAAACRQSPPAAQNGMRERETDKAQGRTTPAVCFYVSFRLLTAAAAGGVQAEKWRWRGRW